MITLQENVVWYSTLDDDDLVFATKIAVERYLRKNYGGWPEDYRYNSIYYKGVYTEDDVKENL
jgi:hypothetical protein